MQANLTDRQYSYLSLNRGRYLCPEHGGFCDSVDNYLDKCPLCAKSAELDSWQINKIDRLLQVVNGLQKRSNRNVALLASLIGGIGVLRLASELGQSTASLLTSDWAKFLTFLAVTCLLLSLAMYGASMAHIRTMQAETQMEKSLSGWEQFLASELGKMERWHYRAGLLFGSATVLLAIAVIFQMATVIKWVNLWPAC